MAYPVACVFIHPCHSFAAELMIFFLYYDIHICSFGLVCGHVDNSEMEQVMYVSHNTGREVACPSSGFGDNIERHQRIAWQIRDQSCWLQQVKQKLCLICVSLCSSASVHRQILVYILVFIMLSIHPYIHSLSHLLCAQRCFMALLVPLCCIMNSDKQIHLQDQRNE